MINNNESYNATCDHSSSAETRAPSGTMSQTTPAKETKARILARSLLDAVMLWRSAWRQLPRLEVGYAAQYSGRTESSRMAPNMGIAERTGPAPPPALPQPGALPRRGRLLHPETWRLHHGKGFRHLADPGHEDHRGLQPGRAHVRRNSTGRRTTSPHFDDAITRWRQGKYLSFPSGVAVRAPVQESPGAHARKVNSIWAGNLSG